MIDILFIHANASKKIYQGLAKDFAAIEPPIWAGMLCQAMLVKGYKAEILDCEATNMDHTVAAGVIAMCEPKVACFVVYGQQPSASTQNMQGATDLADVLRKSCPDMKILFVGGHVAALPAETLRKHPSIDYVCQNEGVYTILGLLQAMNRWKGNLNSNALGFISGLGWRLHGRVVLNHLADIVSKTDLSADLPGVAWDQLPMTKYRTALWHSYTNNCDQGNFASIYTSLGCPYACTFCCINAPFGKRQFRFWDPAESKKHFEVLRAHGVKNLKIADEMFVMNPAHFMAILDVLIEGNYGFNIWCYARIDTVKPEYLEKLKKAGVNWLGLGIESGVKKVRSDVIKGKFEEVDIRSVVNSIQSSGINVAANYIFGLPEDDMDSMRQTFDLALELNTPMANFYSCMAYPGSPLHEEAVKNKVELPDCYAGYSQHSYECQPLPTKHLSAAEVLQFRDTAWKMYHTRNEHEALIFKKFGEDAQNALRKSTSIKLKRRLLGDVE